MSVETGCSAHWMFFRVRVLRLAPPFFVQPLHPMHETRDIVPSFPKLIVRRQTTPRVFLFFRFHPDTSREDFLAALGLFLVALGETVHCKVTILLAMKFCTWGLSEMTHNACGRSSSWQRRETNCKCQRSHQFCGCGRRERTCNCALCIV